MATPAAMGPSVLEISHARSAVAGIERRLATTLEELIYEQPPPGVDIAQFRALQAQKQKAASAEAEAEKMPYYAVLNAQVELQRSTVIVDKAKALQQVMEDIEHVTENSVLEVDWSIRGIERLPEVFGKMVSVERLDISRNDLTMLPDAIAGLANLQYLNLRDNLLTQLPDSIGSLHQLTFLDAGKNNLVQLPESICFCSALEELNVAFNKIESVPEGLGNTLPHLRKLNLGLNKIRYLPKTLGNLESLTYLDAHFNRVHEVPSTIGRLSKLRFLDLSENFADLTELPAAVGDLAVLTHLSLANNQIRELPIELGKLTQLEKLELEGNPWTEPPLDLVEEGDTSKLVQYLAARYKNHLLEHAPAPSSWSEWLSKLLGGDLEAFSNWLNGVIGGEQISALMGARQSQGLGQARDASTEMGTLQAGAAVDLEAQGHSQTLLPVSSQTARETV